MILNPLIITGVATSPFTHRHKLAGTITVDGTGAPRRVMVLERDKLTYVASTIAQPDGSWELTGLPEYPVESLLVLAFDDANQTFNAEVADFISQVATV